MTREYELVYIFDSTLEEEAINERLERFHDLLKSPESPEPISGIKHWGKRTLAYKIDGKDVGYYVIAQFEARPDLLGELERVIKLDEAVLRYLVVLNEGLAPVSALTEETPEPEKPQAEPEKPQAEPETPQAEPETPQAEPETPQAEPETAPAEAEQANEQETEA